jgi:exopolysaccharide biosynthesis protein
LAVHVLVALCSEIHAQDFKTVRPGIEYAEVTRNISGQPVRMNLLRLDLRRVRIDAAHAGGAAIGTETTSSIAKRLGAVAAINAGFFRLDNSAFAGDPAGVFQIDGKLLSEASNGRIALLINNTTRMCGSCAPENRTTISFEHLKTYGELWNSGSKLLISGIDRQRKDGETILYTPEFGDATKPSESKIIEIVIEKKRIRSSLVTNGNTAIPRDGYVIATDQAKAGQLSAFKPGSEAIVIRGSYVDNSRNPTAASAMSFIEAEDIIGGVPQLIKDGKIDVTWEQEKSSRSFVETRHPRTAVAKLKDGKFLMITVDGRSESSGGIGLYDLAAYLLEIGATDAMNLDGGGSTTMFLNGKVVNQPSDKEGERKVSDALLVFPRAGSSRSKKPAN